jgi:hypothetical protein
VMLSFIELCPTVARILGFCLCVPAELGPVPDQEVPSGTSSRLPFPRQDPNHAPRKSLGRSKRDGREEALCYF